MQEQLIQKIYMSVTVDENTCWIWNGSVNNAGYGTQTYDGIRHFVHRAIFEYCYGWEIPLGYQVHHEICENRRCVRYDHLRLVIPSVNNLLKSEFVSKRKERLLNLNEYQRILTTTELATFIGIKRTNVVPYLRSISAVYHGFDFSILKKGKGRNPSIIELAFEPGFFERLEEPEEDWKSQPALCPVSFEFSDIAA